jgi:hypothetical protein
MRTPPRYDRKTESGQTSETAIQRRAVGYIRVSTEMQATEGLSLEAQQSAIEGYCAIQGIKLVCICKEVSRAVKTSGPDCRMRWIGCSVLPIC